MSLDLLQLDPVPMLLRRVKAELGSAFVTDKPVRVSRAPGRLDVMGGIADYTGSLVCEATLDRAAAVALQERNDRTVSVFSFNLFDDHRPFTFLISLDQLAAASIETLRRELDAPGRRWGGYLAGCLAILHDEKLLDLSDTTRRGVNLALYSSVPFGAGVSSSAAIEVATMMNLIAHYGLDDDLSPMRLARLCQRVENEIVGAPCGVMDQAASVAGQAGSLMRMTCQPHELHEPLFFPPGIRAIGINSNVKHSVGGGMYGRTRCAAFMGHKIILGLIGKAGHFAGKEMVADPLNGYLANLDPYDYRKLFRPHLPETIKGGAFVMQFGGTIDKATTIEPDTVYHVRQATDHHVFEADRVKQFVDLLTQAAALNERDRLRPDLLRQAGLLMYASHVSYTDDAKLGAPECDLLVRLVRERGISAGLYGAKITGGGSGGTVAVLCDDGPVADSAVAEILAAYEAETRLKPDAFLASSPGALQAGTAVIEN